MYLMLPHDVDDLSDGVEYGELEGVVLDDEYNSGEKRKQPSDNEADDPAHNSSLQ